MVLLGSGTVKVSYSLALILNQILEEKGLREQLLLSNPKFNDFSESELSSITELTLTSINDLEGIEKLSHLKKLNILSIDFSKSIIGSSVKNNVMINPLKNFDFISKLVNLEELKIENNVFIEALDITSLTKLRKLVLTNNPKLGKLIGLDKLANLKEVLIYGTSISNKIDIEAYIDNTISAPTNILDISMYHSIVDKNRDIAKTISDNVILGRTKLKFGESTGFLDYTKISPLELYDMYVKLDVFLKKNNLYEASDYDKIFFVYNYVTRNIKLDIDALEQRNREYIGYLNKDRNVPSYMFKNLTSLHNSYAAFHFKRANCEGFVNLMKFMLSMLDVPCTNVHCQDKRFGSYIGNNHAVLRTLCNDRWYYCDPTYDTKNPQDYFMKTLEELKDTHVLNDFEIMVNEEKQNGQYTESDFTKKSK